MIAGLRQELMVALEWERKYTELNYSVTALNERINFLEIEKTVAAAEIEKLKKMGGDHSKYSLEITEWTNDR